MNLTTPKLRAIVDRVSAARSEAMTDARQDGPVIRSRGTFLATASGGAQGGPRPEAECPYWGGTLREITELVGIIANEYPGTEKVYIGGGYDAADSVKDLIDGEYSPWASSWEVVLWTKEDGWV